MGTDGGGTVSVDVDKGAAGTAAEVGVDAITSDGATASFYDAHKILE